MPKYTIEVRKTWIRELRTDTQERALMLAKLETLDPRLEPKSEFAMITHVDGEDR